MKEVNEFIINFIGWMIVCIIIGTIHLELFKYNDGILYWISKTLFLVVLVGGPVLCLINLQREENKNEKSKVVEYHSTQRS